MDHMTVNIRQPSVDAVVSHSQPAMVNTRQMQDRGMDVVYLRRMVTVQRLPDWRKATGIGILAHREGHWELELARTFGIP